MRNLHSVLHMIGRLVTLTGTAIGGVLAFSAVPAFAITAWTNWTSATIGSPGSARGTLNGVDVRYSGHVTGAVTNGTAGDWAPDSSFIGGTVTASPSTVRDIIYLTGAYSGPD